MKQKVSILSGIKIIHASQINRLHIFYCSSVRSKFTIEKQLYMYSNCCHHFIAGSNVIFSLLAYSIAEDNGPLQPVLILSNSLSTNVTVQVVDINNTAVGKLTINVNLH